MYRITDHTVRKAILIDNKPVLVEVSGSEQALRVKVLDQKIRKNETEELQHYIAGWFDAQRDLQPFYKRLSAHPALSYMPEAFYGLRLLSIPDLFETLCWAIIGQQINLAFAYRLKRRLVEQYGTAIDHEGELYYLFPSPDAIAAANPETLRAMQFSVRKAEYLIGLAQSFVQGTISYAILEALPGVQERLDMLTSVRGIGIWTANYSLMKCMREPSCVPHGDAGLYNALLQHKIIKNKKDQDAIGQLFASFKGWESYLVLYLWRSLSSSNLTD